MGQPATPKPLKLEQTHVWKEANAIAEHVYSKLEDLPEEEKWSFAQKLRMCASDLMFHIALALGNGSPTGMEYEWGQSRKYAAGMLTMYRFAGRQHFFELDPQIMVRLSALIVEIDTSLASAYQQAEAYQEKDMQPWLEKYKIWQQISKEPKI